MSGGQASPILLAFGEWFITTPNALRDWALSARTGIAGELGGVYGSR
jgi:hypothetical protein